MALIFGNNMIQTDGHTSSASVQLPIYADNMALPAFTRHTLLLLLSAGRAAIDQYFLPAGSTAANLQTGGQMPYCFHTPCSA